MPILHAGDVDLFYQVAGSGEGLLLLHGLGSSTRDWERQIPDFSRRFRVVTLDVRDHGRSSKPPGPYSVELFADDAEAVIRALHLAPAHVAGISMGGMVALELAARSPERVRSLVVINAPPALVVRGLRARREYSLRLLAASLLGMWGTSWVLGRRLFPEPRQAELRRIFRRRWRRNDRRAYLASLRGLAGWSAVDRLSTIACPTLWIAGEGDFIPLEVKRAAAAAMPAARVEVIAGSRHATTADQPERLNAAVLEFLASVPGPAPVE